MCFKEQKTISLYCFFKDDAAKTQNKHDHLAQVGTRMCLTPHSSRAHYL